MDAQNAYKIHERTHDARKLIAKVELDAALKNHADKKKAQYTASKLVGNAMDMYLRISAEDQKDQEMVKTELLKEFERSQLNREEVITEIELVKLAYPTFADAVWQSLAKDYFVLGLSSELQLAV